MAYRPIDDGSGSIYWYDEDTGAISYTDPNPAAAAPAQTYTEAVQSGSYAAPEVKQSAIDATYSQFQSQYGSHPYFSQMWNALWPLIENGWSYNDAVSNVTTKTDQLLQTASIADPLQRGMAQQEILGTGNLTYAQDLGLLSDVTPEQGQLLGQMGAQIQASQDSDGAFNATPQLSDTLSGIGVHAGNILDLYKENPEMLLTAGAAGPVGSSLESDLWGTDTPAASTPLGQASDTTLQEMEAKGIDTEGQKVLDTIGPLVGTYFAGAGLSNALGAGSAPAYANSGYAGAFDTYGSLGTGLESGVGGAGYVPVDAAAYTGATGGTVYAGGSPTFDETTQQYITQRPSGSFQPYPDAELQAILDSAQSPTISQGVNVAGEPGAVQMPTSPMSGYQPPAWAGEQVPAAPGSAEALAQPTYQPNLNLTTQAPTPWAPTPPPVSMPVVVPPGGASLITPGTVGTAAGTTAAATAASQAAQSADAANQTGAFDQAGSANNPTTGEGGIWSGSGTEGQVPPGAMTSGSTLSRILDGSATGADWTSFLGTIGGSALGAYGAHEQAGALRDIAGKEDARIREMMTWGAPSRARYEASFAPGFDANQIPGYTQALDTNYQTLLRQLSAQGGNPFGNPSGLAEAMKYVTGNVALPAIQNYRNMNAGAGGLVQYAAGAAQGPNLAPGMGAAQANQGIFGALGYGLAQTTRPNYGYSGWSLV